MIADAAANPVGTAGNEKNTATATNNVAGTFTGASAGAGKNNDGNQATAINGGQAVAGAGTLSPCTAAIPTATTETT